MLILSPARAVERPGKLRAAPRPLPKNLSADQRRQAQPGHIFEGETINTPSMLCVEDYLDAPRLGENRSAGSRR